MRMLYCRTMAAMLAEADDNHSRANKGEHSGKEQLAELQEKDTPNLNNLVEKGRHAEIFVGGLLIDLEGRIVGMNFIDENKTPFLPVQIVGRCLKHFRNLVLTGEQMDSGCSLLINSKLLWLSIQACCDW
ncbi:uncharacterized protein LOC125540116 isoform X2 [Triticum urartu]|uniref:uncharacterized protein LOC125540073 isoform X2 n=1 Tax=Triticum urartu TaxID=4572 RepID=UPI0020436DED|nr:uncharacterized protein LOC125540073 isoform X2 [Triticum urartu]XP_048559660.1 uncharacterized protein LOC125540116 isoform X2 [Triticum urartu]